MFKTNEISCGNKMRLKKRGISYGWLYLSVFILATAAILVAAVPQDSWPSDIVEKIATRFKAIKPDLKLFPGLKPGCSSLDERECMQKMSRGCVPRYSRRSRVFLDCTTCTKYPTCSMFEKEAVCINNPCRLDCRWVIGHYEGGYTIHGRCIENIGIVFLKRDLESLGFDTAKLGLEGMDNIEKTMKTASITMYKAGDNILVIDKNQSDYIYMKLSTKDAVAIDKKGNVVVGMEKKAAEAIDSVI